MRTQEMRAEKSRCTCLPSRSEEGTGSFLAGASAMANGNALRRLLSWVTLVSPAPHIPKLSRSGNYMYAGTAWDLGVQKVYQSAIQPARTQHGSTFGTWWNNSQSQVDWTGNGLVGARWTQPDCPTQFSSFWFDNPGMLHLQYIED